MRYPGSPRLGGGFLVSGPARTLAGMRSTRPEDITAEVVERLAGCDDERLRAIMQGLVRHLHAFAVDVGLTQREWEAAVRILTETGEITDAHRQEFVLWSDALGLSMLVDAIAHARPDGATESTVLGPFYVPGSPLRGYGDSIALEPAGVPALVYGRVLDLAGEPIAGAELDVWQNGANELYAVQDAEAEEDHLRGRFLTRADGSYAFVGVRPTPYAIPHDGPVGRMLAVTGRHPWRPAHLHLIVRAPGYATVTTHVFDEASRYLDSDAVFAVKPTLLRTFVEREPLDPARPAGVDGPWCSVENDIVLAPDPDER
jgi:hydroxyquinol 1,2-dioxygenase